MTYQQTFEIHTRGRGTTEITADIARLVRVSFPGRGPANIAGRVARLMSALLGQAIRDGGIPAE